LERLYNKVEVHQKVLESWIAKALRSEGERRIIVDSEIAGEVTQIRNDMQEFVNKQLPCCVREAVKAGLTT
jgi:hypothetical protein